MTTAITHPLPAGTVEALGDWELNGDNRLARFCAGVARGNDAVSVGLVAEQEYPGNVLRRVGLLVVKGAVVDLDAPALRQLAADALATADELESLQ